MRALPNQMDDQRAEALIRFLRHYAKLTAELPALESLLDTYAETNEVPKNWRDALAELRKSETYADILREIEPTVADLRLSSVDEELIALLLKMSGGKPPN